MREAVRRRVLKVIIESALLDTLDPGAIEVACRAAEDAGADFVKTSTGFHPAGGAVRRGGAAHGGRRWAGGSA